MRACKYGYDIFVHIIARNVVSFWQLEGPQPCFLKLSLKKIIGLRTNVFLSFRQIMPMKIQLRFKSYMETLLFVCDIHILMYIRDRFFFL